MPRYPANSLESISLSREDLVDRALQAEPPRTRRYTNETGLASLRRRLFAIERWADRLMASPQSRLMVAARLSPPALAAVIRDLADEAAHAAPEQVGSRPSHDAKSWCPTSGRSSPPARGSQAEAEADRLIYILEQLGDYVGGSWQLVPCWPLIDSAGDDDVPMELVQSEPSQEVIAVIDACRVFAIRGSRLRAEKSGHDARQALIGFARSAAADLDDRLRDGIAGLSMHEVTEKLANAGERAQAAHANLLAAVQEIRRAMEPDAEARGSWWRDAGRSIAQQVDEWLETVPPALQVARHKRQQLKRDMETTFGQVLQCALLLQGNEASYQLVLMVDHLRAVCRRLRETLDRIIPVPLQQAATAPEEIAAEVGGARLLVSEEQLDRWRSSLGGNALQAGRLVQEAVGIRGQRAGLQMSEIVRLAAAAAKRGGQRAIAQRKLESMLSEMQQAGLAIRLPASAFLPDGEGRRPGRRRRPHAGRAWWFNPLGAALAMPRC